MGNVVKFHCAASQPTGAGISWKSSAVIPPPLSSFSFSMVDQFGRTILRRIRLTVTREQPIASATSSSDRPRSVMNWERCAMPDLYTQRTMQVKPNCTPGVLYRGKSYVHDVYMVDKKAKKVVPRLKRPEYQKTFIKQWREYRTMTQEKLAERVTAFLLERGAKKGYTYASIGRLERGLMPYSQPVLEALADSLGTDPASLLIRDPTDPTGIWTIWEKALPAERATITEHAEIVVKKTRKA